MNKIIEMSHKVPNPEPGTAWGRALMADKSSTCCRWAAFYESEINMITDEQKNNQ